MHHILLNHLQAADQTDWSRRWSIVLRCVLLGVPTGPNPTNRGKPDSKHHSQLVPLVDRIPRVAGRVGRPRWRPDRVQGDRAYDSQAHRDALHKRGIAAVLAGADRRMVVAWESIGGW